MKRKHHFVLTKRDRERIEPWLEEQTHTEIAKRIGCHRSTISREVLRGTDSTGVYRATYAEKKAQARIRSRKLGKRRLLLNPSLQTYVHTGLQNKWSPKQIAEMLKAGLIQNNSC